MKYAAERGVDNDREAVKMNYLSMIRSAKKKIRIQSPYFIPDASVLDALKTAAASGVETIYIIYDTGNEEFPNFDCPDSMPSLHPCGSLFPLSKK